MRLNKEMETDRRNGRAVGPPSCVGSSSPRRWLDLGIASAGCSRSGAVRHCLESPSIHLEHANASHYHRQVRVVRVEGLFPWAGLLVVLLAVVLGMGACAGSDEGRGASAPRSGEAAWRTPTDEDALRLAFIRARQDEAEDRYAAIRRGDEAILPRRGRSPAAALGKDGMRIAARAGEIGVRWAGIGRPGALQDPGEGQTLTVSDARVELVHGGGRTSWWQSGPLGLEQGFVVASAPAPGAGAPESESERGELLLAITVEGLAPSLTADETRVRLMDDAGREALSVSDLFAEDASGQLLPVGFSVVQGDVVLRIDDRNAVYPIVVDPLWVEQVKMTASDAAADDWFGASVSLAGDRALVGAYADDDAGSGSGSAYVFYWDGTSWTEEAKLTASDAAAGDNFGNSVSLSGNRALVGAYFDDDAGSLSGSAYVYYWDGTSWSEEAKLTASDGAAGDIFGASVSLAGNRALVGAIADDDAGSGSGSAYVFYWDGTSWTEEAKLAASDAAAGDSFGISVSLSGSRALVGVWRDDDGGIDSGSAYVFFWNGTSWTEEAKLTASDAAAEDRFGRSVSLSGNRALVGAFKDDDAGVDSGSAYVFFWDGTSWTEEAKLTASDSAADDFFGIALSLSGDRALVGASKDEDAGSLSGSAYVFFWDGTSWAEEIKLTASDAAAGDIFGGSVSLAGARALVGASQDDDDGINSGSAYDFVLVEPVVPDGDPCSLDAECSSGFCVDGLCCDTACGGGATGDCQACNLVGLEGTCSSEAAGAPCGDQGVDCQVNDACDGSGSCTDNGFTPQGTSCGDASETQCTNADTCDATGNCLSNHEPPGAPCGDQGVDCQVDDVCDGSGSCTDNGFMAQGTSCGDASETECTNADTCDATGNCLPNHETAGMPCGDQSIDCHVSDACDGSGSCTDNGFMAEGMSCGDNSGFECTNADTCDATGNCLANHKPPGTPCGDQGVDCHVDDACDGHGNCTDNGFVSHGAACSDGVCDGGECMPEGTSGTGGEGGGAQAANGGQDDGWLLTGRGSCGCRVPGGSSDDSSTAWLALLPLGWLLHRRRRPAAA